MALAHPASISVAAGASSQLVPTSPEYRLLQAAPRSGGHRGLRGTPNSSHCPVGTQPYPTSHGVRIAGTNRFAYCDPCGFCGLSATQACPYTLEDGCQDHPRSLVGETTCFGCQSLSSALTDLGDGHLVHSTHTTHSCPRVFLGLSALVWHFAGWVSSPRCSRIFSSDVPVRDAALVLTLLGSTSQRLCHLFQLRNQFVVGPFFAFRVAPPFAAGPRDRPR